MRSFRKSPYLTVSMRRIVLWLVVIGVFSVTIDSSHAGFLSVSGNGQTLPIPSDLTEGQFESSLVSGFSEAQNVNITAATIAVDYLIGPGDVGSQFPGVANPPASPLYLGAGNYSSHILHFDPVGASGDVYDATFVFDGQIVGVIANTTFLNDSDTPLGILTTTYETDVTRGFSSAGQAGGVADLFTITSLNSLTIDFITTIDGHMDELRVITVDPVPEPSTYAMAVVGLLGLLAWRRRR